MANYAASILEAFIAPLGYLASPGKRIYVPFLGIALLMAIFVYWRQKPRKSAFSLRELGRFVFPRSIWLHPSAWLDYKLVFVNAILRAIILTPILIPAAGVSAVVATLLDTGFGTLDPITWSRVSIGVTYTIALFITGDLSRYILHRLLHTVPLLWEFHQIHHSAEVLTPVTVYRSHPIEVVLYAIRRVLSVGLATGVCFYFFGTQLNGYDALGINVVGFTFNMLGANLRHSHIWLSYGPAIERLLISPAQHQIHHSIDPRHHNRNLGAFLAIWDWIGGTLYTTNRREELSFGLPEEELNHTGTVTSSIVQPLATAAKRLRGSTRVPVGSVKKQSSYSR